MNEPVSAHDDSIGRLDALADTASRLLALARAGGADQAEVSCSEERGLNASVETTVLEAPAQYQWEYKRFKRQPPGQPRPY